MLWSTHVWQNNLIYLSHISTSIQFSIFFLEAWYHSLLAQVWYMILTLRLKICICYSFVQLKALLLLPLCFRSWFHIKVLHNWVRVGLRVQNCQLLTISVNLWYELGSHNKSNFVNFNSRIAVTISYTTRNKLKKSKRQRGLNKHTAKQNTTDWLSM